MKLLESIVLALCVVSLAIGVHQLYYYKVEEVYWILSLSMLLFLVYTFVRSKNAAADKAKEQAEKKQNNVLANKEKAKQSYKDTENSNYMPPKKKRKKRN